MRLRRGRTRHKHVHESSIMTTDATTNSSQLYFIRDGRARVAVVQLGAARDNMVQVLSGISPNAVIATDHLPDLFDGMVVKTTQKGQ